MPWNDKPLFAVGHHDVAALPGNVEAKFFKDPHSVALADARKFWHKLNGDKFAGKTRAVSLRLALSIFLGYFEPELNGLANVGQRFVMRRALTVATGQCGAGNGEAFFGFDHDDLILHGFKIRSAEMQIKLICRRRDIFVEPNPNQIKVLANGHQRSGVSGGASVLASRENCLAHVGSRGRPPHQTLRTICRNGKCAWREGLEKPAYDRKTLIKGFCRATIKVQIILRFNR